MRYGTEHDRSIWNRRESLWRKDNFGGFQYNTELANQNGSCVMLFVPSNATLDQIENANVSAKRKIDVVYFVVVFIPDGWCNHNSMVKNDNPDFAWKCADCGYVYGVPNLDGHYRYFNTGE